MMKKGLFVSLLVFTIGAASVTMAQDGGLSFTSKFTNTAPTVDGTLAAAEWANALKIEVDATDEVPPGVVSEDSGPIVPPGIQTRDDFNATIYVMNDAANLYVGIDVHDDVLIFSKADQFRNDGAEIRIDSNFSRSAPKDGGHNGYSVDVLGDNSRKGALPAGASAVASLKADGTGWTLEFSTPTANYKEIIGFDVAINDSDTTTTLNRDAQVRINALADSSWDDEAQWARLTLAKPGQQSHAANWDLME